MALIEIWREQDLSKTVEQQYIDGNFFSADNDGNLVGVKCYKDGAEATLTGSVTGYCVLSDGTTVPLTGTRSGNQAYIIINQTALSVPGLIGVTIQLIDGTTKTTLLSIMANVYQSKTDAVVTPSQQIITDWANQINAALQAVTDASAAQDEKIADLKSAFGVWNCIENNGGIYTVSSSVMESGYWGYSTKMANSKRLRCSFLIPVKAGMLVRYTNPTMKVFFGVLETNTSNAYLQMTGWANAGSKNIRVPILYDGYLTIMVESTNDITPSDFDITIVLTTAQYQIDNVQTKKINLITGKEPISFTVQAGIAAETGNYYYATNRISTAKIILPKGTYYASVQDDYKLMLYKNSSLYGGDISRIVFDASGEEEIAFILKTDNDSDIDINASIQSYYEPFEPEELKENKLNGVKMIHFTDNVVRTVLSMYTSSAHKESKIYKMPESGINVEQIDEANDTKYHAVMFFRKVNGLFVPATDYNYGNIKWTGTTPTFLFTRASIYFPYDDNLYFCLVFTSNGVPDNLYISYGTVQNGNGRLTNLAPASAGSGRMPAPNENITGIYPSFTQWTGKGYSTQQHFYGTVIRLQDAKAICCSADLSLACWWYNNDGVLIGKVHGTNLTDIAVTGLNYIDLGQYGTEGYCVVLIRSPFTAKQPESDATVTVRDEPTMGGLHLYNYVLNNVFVQYYNRTVITHDVGLNPKIVHNIELMKNLNCGDTFAFNYRGPVTPTAMAMRPMKNVSPCFYAASGYYNILFQNVSLKSYVTALQNPNSQMYLVGYGGNAKRYNAFGMVCVSIPPVLSGYEWTSHLTLPGANPVESHPGFDYVVDWDYTKEPDKLRPGDWLIGKTMDEETEDRGHDVHVILITDAIRINGELVCYEGMEAYPPYIKYRYIYMSSPLERFNIEFSRNEQLGTYFNRIARPQDPSTFKTLEEAFGDMSTDYTVGTLMCDRGTDSVYGVGQQHCYITVNDSEMTSFAVYKDGAQVANIAIPASGSSTWVNWWGEGSLSAIDIISTIRANGAGYYTLIPDNKSTVQESFYVGGIKQIRFDWPVVGDTVAISIEDPEEVQYIECVYYKDVDGVMSSDKTTRATFLQSDIINGVLTIPAHTDYWQDWNYTFNYCCVVYKATRNGTKLGTYYVMRDEDPTLGGTAGTYVSSDQNWGVRFTDA